jgi:hypothetical protein
MSVWAAAIGAAVALAVGTTSAVQADQAQKAGTAAQANAMYAADSQNVQDSAMAMLGDSDAETEAMMQALMGGEPQAMV